MVSKISVDAFKTIRIERNCTESICTVLKKLVKSSVINESAGTAFISSEFCLLLQTYVLSRLALLFNRLPGEKESANNILHFGEISSFAICTPFPFLIFPFGASFIETPINCGVQISKSTIFLLELRIS